MSYSGRGFGLSKTSLLKGIQCPKAIYLFKNPPAFAIPADPDLEAKFQAGQEVGVLALQLFPGGTEVPYSGFSVTEQIAKTRELIAAGAEVTYEASFAFDGIFIKADILVRKGASWEIHEVKKPPCSHSQIGYPQTQNGSKQLNRKPHFEIPGTSFLLINIAT